ncbi:polysaccharide biosynthesis/export family protein [Rubinisphaera margarita]|uniref:polysaccharide biosynthesis/export family protein n=1 Tax=Rubinisphaera margarita TaxID=2909586 RepID=UPI001EE8B9BC|nr:polysaccharide biosynthesis/export family protein [Rubinisphaera margarita]MCG6155285.1 hypothetical protein [Rubinisphaera margarita]
MKATKLDPSLSLPCRTGQKTINLALLRQVPPPEHLVDTGDTLGVFVEGILGGIEEAPPIYLPQQDIYRPGMGYPVTVHANGTITLPLVPPVFVRGMTIYQVQEAVIKAYTTGVRPLLQPDQARVLVSLNRPRTSRVLVIRQESDNRQGNLGASESVNFEADKQGTGRIVELPAYQNDVLHALAETGGLPGLDAQNMIYVIRRDPVVPPHFLPVHPHGPAPNGYYQPMAAPPLSMRDQTRSKPAEQVTVRAQGPDGPLPVQSSSYRSNYRSGPLHAASSYRSAPQGTTAASHALPVRESSVSAHQPASQISRYGGTPVTPASHGIANGPAEPGLPGWQPPPMLAPQPYANLPQYEGPTDSISGAYHPPEYQAGPGAGLYEELDYTQDHELRNYLGVPSGSRIIRIPVRLFPGEPIPFTPEDILLQDGDIVFIESRELEFYYTGGLLGGGQYTLPRDYDINILDAISIAETRARFGQFRGNPKSIGGPSVLNQDVSVGASKAIIARPLPEGGQMQISIDLAKAMHDPAQQIIIKPGDRIYLRYTFPEACLAYLERHLLEGSIIGATIGNSN